jgi:uncharacterized cupin superfamily protein
VVENHFLVFPKPDGEPARAFPKGWTVVEGDPVATTSRHYASDDGALIAGHWVCTEGAFEVEYFATEFCHLLDGQCVITPVGSEPILLGAGDAFVVEKGFKGRWQVTREMKKHFVFKLA